MLKKSQNPLGSNLSLDQIDRQLISLLSSNSKLTNIKIAKQLSLSEGAVRFRIKKLENSGVIKKYTIEISDNSQLHSSNEIYAIVMVKSKGDSKALMKSISDLAISHEIFEIDGEFDGCIILKADSISDLDSKIDKIRNLNDAADTKTSISFKKW